MIFQLSYHPVIQRTVIFKFQRTDGMGNALDGILDGMCKIVHRIDTPFISGIVMCHMRHTVNDRISHVHIWAMPYRFWRAEPFRRRHICPSFISSNRARFSSTLLSAPGSILAGLGQRTAVFTDLIRGQDQKRKLCLSESALQRPHTSGRNSWMQRTVCPPSLRPAILRPP